MIRRWKAWEAGDGVPDDFYQPLIASTFGTVTRALFPLGNERYDSQLIAATGMDTLEIVSRLRASDVDAATLDAMRITVDRLCSDYPHVPAQQLVIEGRQWLRRVVELQEHRLTLAQHREVLTLAGWLALLVGCVEYDSGERAAAEATRRAALGLAQEAESAEVHGWALEMSAWFALTSGNYRGVISASQEGMEVAPHHGVAVQLAAQQAKAWARIGDRRQTEVALDRGRRMLELLPHPENIDHHFVVDPSKFDFYAMDCYRRLGETQLAEVLAGEVIRTGTDFDGHERSPMRIAEARVTLGVVAARQGDLDTAVGYGERALSGDRKSIPSLLMVSRDLSAILRSRYESEPLARGYIEHLEALGARA